MNPNPQQMQEEVMGQIQQLQQRDSLRMYNSLVHKCFNECARNFKTKKLDPKEEKCINECSEKFIKLTQRVGYRFAEYQSQNGPAGGPGTAPPS